MHAMVISIIQRQLLIGSAVTLTVLLLTSGVAISYATPLVATFVATAVLLLLAFVAFLGLRVQRMLHGRLTTGQSEQLPPQSLLVAGALEDAIFYSANFSSIVTDDKGFIQIFNVGAEQMLGYSAAEVLNKFTPADISDPQELITLAKSLSIELATPIAPGFEALVSKASRGIGDIYELTYIRKDGSHFPAVVSVTALHNALDTIIGYLMIGTDNTVRKKAEAAQALLDQRLRDQQFYTRSLIESNIDALMATDPRGIISDVNQQMEHLTASTRDELIGAPFKSYFTDPERAEAAITLVLREGKVTNYELTTQARDGTRTVVSFNASTFYDRDRNLQGVFASARNITERKEIEHALQEKNIELESARAASEKANQAKSEFLSSMSHELRTPLNAILGFAQLIAGGKPPPSEAQKLSINQILKAGWYLLRLINEILDLAMIEAGKVTLSQETMALTDVLKDCKAMIEPQAHERQVQLIFPDIEQPFYIHADSTRVKQVMINLLSNAIKYNHVGGLVVVECVIDSKNWIRFSVRDTGAGLTPKQLTQLFQPFNRLGQEVRSEEGTGIGLVVTKQLVELMGGNMGVESTVGIGTVFWVELPAAKAPTQMSSHIDPIHVDNHDPMVTNTLSLKYTLLYVEDNPENLLLVEQIIMQRSDINLLTAINGNHGILLAQVYQPDVILMDINLPDLSGYDCLKILRDNPLTAHILVVALSAMAIPGNVKQGLEAGFFRYLTKPINVEEFMNTIDLALNCAVDDAVARETKAVI